MPDDSTFFSIAAGLLPTFMLAGFLSDKLKPPQEKHQAPRAAFWVLLAAGLYFVLAEITAIRAAISGEPTDFDRWVVSIALIAAASGTVFPVLRTWIENVDQGKRRAPYVALVGGLVAIGIVSVLMLSNAVQGAARSEDLRANEAAWDRLLTEQRRLYAQEDRLERELSGFIIRESKVLRRPRSPDTRGKLFLLREQRRSVENQLDDVADQLRRLRDESERLNEETERLLGNLPGPGLVGGHGVG
jgi:hypothetical protein